MVWNTATEQSLHRCLYLYYDNFDNVVCILNGECISQLHFKSIGDNLYDWLLHCFAIKRNCFLKLLRIEFWSTMFWHYLPHPSPCYGSLLTSLNAMSERIETKRKSKLGNYKRMKTISRFIFTHKYFINSLNMKHI